MTITCKTCGERKQLAEFYMKEPGRYDSRCKQCVRTLQKEYKATTKGKATVKRHTNSEKGKAGNRNRSLKFKYGITTQEYDRLFLSQGAKCAVCSKPWNGHTKKFPVDHDHVTGQVRGIVCWTCNTALGAFGDNLDSVNKFSLYLAGGYLSWDRYFIEHARTVARKSKDPSTKVGAVLVKNKRIISSGYNGLPSKLADLPERYVRPEKYKWILHAEENAILQCVIQPVAGGTQDATLYTTPFQPCRECTKVIIQAGIIRVVHDTQAIPNRWNDDFAQARDMLQEAGVVLEEIK